MAVKSGVSPERSTFGDMVSTGKSMVSKSTAGKRTGPSNKNLGPSASSKANPASQVSRVRTRALVGAKLPQWR